MPVRFSKQQPGTSDGAPDRDDSFEVVTGGRYLEATGAAFPSGLPS